MHEHDNLRIVQDYLAEHSPKLIAEDAVLIDHGWHESFRGPDAIGELLYDMYHVAFPGAEATVTAMHAAGDSVVLEFTFSGRNDGPFMGAPASGREVSFPMCAVYEVAGGKIRRIRLYYDSATVTDQLGRSGAT